MSGDEYQSLAGRTEAGSEPAASRLADVVRLSHAVLGMASEVGELADALKRHVWHGKPLDVHNVKEELGDVAWYLAMACSACGLQLSEVLEANVRKLKVRYPERYEDVLSAQRCPEAEKEEIGH